jgi:hypothetical protein
MSGLGVDLRHWQTANFGQKRAYKHGRKISRYRPFELARTRCSSRLRRRVTHPSAQSENPAEAGLFSALN